MRFVIPEEGGMSWADTMVMPKGAPNRDQAAKWMDFVYDPVQAAQITACVQFVSPVAGVQEEVAKLDPELAESPLLFPDEETLAELAVVRQPAARRSRPSSTPRSPRSPAPERGRRAPPRRPRTERRPTTARAPAARSGSAWPR